MPDEVDEPDHLHMDADAQLLAAVERGEQPATIRCYRWREPAVTLGRLQDEDAAGQAFPGLPLYRRPTGGRAVRHGDDLTICIAVLGSQISTCVSGAIGVTSAYHLLTEPLKRALRKFGVDPQSGVSAGVEFGSANSQDCFASTARCDVLDAKHGIKIVGCALRRSARAILLQMSLRPLPEIDIFRREFLDELRRQYERCLNIGRRDFA